MSCGTVLRDFVILSGSILLAMGCASSPATKDVAPETNIVETETEGDKNIQRFDLNGDGKPDMEKIYKSAPGAQAAEGGAAQEGAGSRELLEKRMDLDYNGTFDIHSYYKGGVINREQIDLDFDGKPDAENVYRGGKLTERRLAPGFDGNFAVWKYFNSEGALTKKARDTDANSRPDVWEYYRDQQLIRIGYDRDGDGSPEYFEDVKD